MLDPLFLQGNSHPEGIDAQGHDDQHKPFDPLTKKSDRRTAEFEPSAVDDRVIDPPAVNHGIGPGIGDSKGD